MKADFVNVSIQENAGLSTIYQYDGRAGQNRYERGLVDGMELC